MLTTVFIEKGYKWTKRPNNDLTIEISGVTEKEYADIVKHNLHLRKEKPKAYEVENRGRILLDESERSNIYVKGLYVTSIEQFKYGYDFEPQILGLDRDRRMVNTFNVSWESSVLWKYAAKDEQLRILGLQLIDEEAADVSYITDTSYAENDIFNAAVSKFKETNGENAVPVTNNEDYEYIKNKTEYKPVIVSLTKAKVLSKLGNSSTIPKVKRESVKDELLNFIDKIEHKLSDDELEELRAIAEKVTN